MQTFTSGTVSPGELPVTLTPAGVIITIANTEILIEDTADADQGLIAFAAAKTLLAGELCPDWLVETDTGNAFYCELQAGHEEDHRAPGARKRDPDVRWRQHAPRGEHPYALAGNPDGAA